MVESILQTEMEEKYNEILNPKSVTLLRLGKDKQHRGNFYYAGFDEKGDFIHIIFRNNKIIDQDHSFKERELKQFGFNIMTQKENDTIGYLEGKKLKIDDICGCITSIDQLKTKTCNSEQEQKENCLEPIEIKFFNKRY